MSNITFVSHSEVPQSVASLPKYNVSSFIGLPADAAPEGVFANGDVYYEAYAALTPSDTALIESVTGDKSVTGDPLAAAIGTDRADAAIGLPGGLTGDVTTTYLQSIEAALANPHSDGTYDGIKVSSSEINDAIDYLNANGESRTSNSIVSVSA